MDYFNRDEPFRKKNTRALNFEGIKDSVFKVSRTIYSKSPTIAQAYITPNKIISSPPPIDREGKIDLLKKVLNSDHRINKKSIQIIKLPKLPFGRHQNYNREDLFVSNHFIPCIEPGKTKELDDVVKKFRLFEKQFNRGQKITLELAGNYLKNTKVLTYKTKAGLLICKRNKSVVSSYDRSSSKYKLSKQSSLEKFDILEEQPISRPHKSSKSSIDHVVNRLYPTPEPHTNKIFNDIVPRYSILFETNASNSKTSVTPGL